MFRRNHGRGEAAGRRFRPHGAALERALCAGVTLACFLYLLKATWLTWGSLVVDTPRELWVPLQLLEGKVLYREVVYQFGFFPPYVIAGLYRVFGVGSHAAVGCGIAVTALETVFLYRLSRLFLPRPFATLNAVGFLFVLAFGHYSGNHIFNFVLPYAFPSTFCTLFLTASLYFFLKFARRPARRHYLLGASALTLSFVSRPEMTLPFFLLLLAAGGALLIARRRPARDWLWLLWPPLAGLAAYGAFFAAHGNARGFATCFGDIVSLSVRHPMVREWMGVDDVGANGARMAYALCMWLLAVGTLVAIPSALALAASGGRRLRHALAAAVMAPLFLFAAGELRPANEYFGLPLLLGGGLIVSLARLRRGYAWEHLASAVLYGGSLALLPRILLNAGPSFYGFYLLTLPMVGGNVFLLNVWRPLVGRILPERVRAASLLLAALFVFQIADCWNVSRSLYGLHRTVFTSPRGSMRCADDASTGAIQEAVDFLRDRTPRDATVVGFPLGYAFSFYGERRMPLSDGDFTYWRMAPRGERGVLASLEHARPDYAVLMAYSRPEDGYEVFGRDYGREVFRWLLTGYRPVRQIGPLPFAKPGFGLTVFGRAGA